MELPADKGTYVLIASVPQMKRIEVGQLGEFEIVPGFYSYVGSAFGEGELAVRIGHHLESAAAPHWHIDYLLQVTEPVEVWYTIAGQKLEHHWAGLFEQAPQFRIPSRGSVPRITTAAVRATCFIPSAAPLLGGFDSSFRNDLKMSMRNDVF
jgi:Uri superfamily endonuclease